jgi:hypothetical protein
MECNTNKSDAIELSYIIIIIIIIIIIMSAHGM